jgi:hypothetical protein
MITEALLPRRHNFELDLISLSPCFGDSSVSTTCSSTTIKHSNRSAIMADPLVSMEECLAAAPTEVIRGWLESLSAALNHVHARVRGGTQWTEDTLALLLRIELQRRQERNVDFSSREAPSPPQGSGRGGLSSEASNILTLNSSQNAASSTAESFSDDGLHLNSSSSDSVSTGTESQVQTARIVFHAFGVTNDRRSFPPTAISSPREDREGLSSRRTGGTMGTSTQSLNDGRIPSTAQGIDRGRRESGSTDHNAEPTASNVFVASSLVATTRGPSSTVQQAAGSTMEQPNFSSPGKTVASDSTNTSGSFSWDVSDSLYLSMDTKVSDSLYLSMDTEYARPLERPRQPNTNRPAPPGPSDMSAATTSTERGSKQSWVEQRQRILAQSAIATDQISGTPAPSMAPPPDTMQEDEDSKLPAKSLSKKRGESSEPGSNKKSNRSSHNRRPEESSGGSFGPGRRDLGDAMSHIGPGRGQIEPRGRPEHGSVRGRSSRDGRLGSGWLGPRDSRLGSGRLGPRDGRLGSGRHNRDGPAAFGHYGPPRQEWDRQGTRGARDRSSWDGRRIRERQLTSHNDFESSRRGREGTAPPPLRGGELYGPLSSRGHQDHRGPPLDFDRPRNMPPPPHGRPARERVTSSTTA